MWKTFENDGQLYMIKVEQEENLTIYLTDLKNIWSQNISKEYILEQFQELNPLFDIKMDEAVTQVIDLINQISEAIDIEIATNFDKIQLTVKLTKSDIDIKFKFDFEKLSSDIFLKQVTVPLIQTVKNLEEQQKILCNLIAKKDRELEEYKLEKGGISREDLITEKFDENSIKIVDEKSMMNVFDTSKSFWNTFTEKYGDIKVKVEDVQKDPWNHIKRKRKVYSAKTAIKKEINYEEMLDDDEDEEKCTFSDTTERSETQTLPERSQRKYEVVYKAFMDWRSSKNLNSFSENVFLAYFSEQAKKYKSSTLWSIYSMIRSTVSIHNNVHIEHYHKLKEFLKRQSKNYEAKKKKLFTPTEINDFLNNASDEKYLATKVILIMGLIGACRTNELYKMNVNDIEDLNTTFLVTIPAIKPKTPRKFIITGEFYKIVKKYLNLRPEHVTTDAFFINYQRGKCTSQKIGVNKMSAMGQQIAKFLKLPEAERYSCRSFRHSSTTLLVNPGTDFTP